MTRIEQEQLADIILDHINRYGVEGLIKRLEAISDPEYIDTAANLIAILSEIPG